LNEFPNGPTKDRYRDIHSRLRLPYWDWAKRTSSNEPILPNVITQTTVGVTFPNGTKATISNPLLLYRFHPFKQEQFPSGWSQDTTVRGDTVESNLQSWMPDTKRTLYQILTQWQTYNEFSNHGSEGSFIGNLESIHDTIHVTFGFAHMSDPSVAAFDPVFWLHHANVDRLLAIWQRIYPNTYVSRYEQQSGGTWTIAPNSFQDATSPLTPFHRNANGDYHTSDTSRTTDAFQYSYPEILGNPSNATLKATVNRLYAPATTSITKRQDEEAVPELRLSPSEPRAFLAAIEAPLHSVGAYHVEMFMGDITAPTSDWIKDPNFVGGQTMMSRIAKDDVIVKGSVVLTEALKEKYSAGQLESLETEAVVAYLKDNLHWRVQNKGFDEEIPREDIPNFKINVLSTEVKPAESSEEFPAYVGEWVEHPEVTAGRPGGGEA
jgi:tyrosinase